jgi:predicted nucleic acid-binding protein
MTVALVDTGPLLALFDKNDPGHAWATHLFKHHTGKRLTCDAVVTEAMYFLGAGSAEALALIEGIERGIVHSTFVLSDQLARMRWLMNKYASVPMSFADACLVRMAELHGDVVVWTVDSDFSVYRRHGRQGIPTLMPR